MSRAYEVEADWTTTAGLRAVVIKTGAGLVMHRCGYVGVPKTSPLYGVDYHEQTDLITKAHTKGLKVGKKGAILALTAFVNADTPEAVRRSLDVVIDVHGGLTYSSSKEGSDYPVPSEEPTWWFGYDCAHLDDTLANCSLDYCRAECEEMARQFKELVE